MHRRLFSLTKNPPFGRANLVVITEIPIYALVLGADSHYLDCLPQHYDVILAVISTNCPCKWRNFGYLKQTRIVIIRTYVRACVCVYVSMCVCMHAHKHAHTHAHTIELHFHKVTYYRSTTLCSPTHIDTSHLLCPPWPVHKSHHSYMLAWYLYILRGKIMVGYRVKTCMCIWVWVCACTCLSICTSI